MAHVHEAVRSRDNREEGGGGRWRRSSYFTVERAAHMLNSHSDTTTPTHARLLRRDMPSGIEPFMFVLNCSLSSLREAQRGQVATTVDM